MKNVTVQTQSWYAKLSSEIEEKQYPLQFTEKSQCVLLAKSSKQKDLC